MLSKPIGFKRLIVVTSVLTVESRLRTREEFREQPSPRDKGGFD